MSNFKYKIPKIFFCFFILISILIFFACKAEKSETGAEEELNASQKIFKSKNFSPEKRVEKFLKAVKEKDFKTIFAATYYYQMKLSEIKSNNPKILWEKSTTEYYEAEKNAVLKGEKKSSLFNWSSPFTSFTFIIKPTKDIHALMNSLNSSGKWKVIETTRKLERDESSGRQYDVFKVYVSLNYPKVDESPLINGKLLKKRILSIYLDAKTGLYIRHYYVEKGDVYWKNVPKEERARRQQLDKMKAEIIASSSTLEDLKRILPEKEELSQIIKNIQSNISNTGLRILSFSPRPERKDTNAVYIEKPYSISVEGNYHNLGVFFDKLSRLKKIFTVEILNITTIRKSSTEFIIKANFTASTYLYRKTKKVRILKYRKAKKTQLENVLKTLENLERIKARLDKKVKIINQLKSRQKIVAKMMDDMSNVIPDRVWLKKLNFSRGALTISGKALSNNLIADLIKNMQNTNHFSNVRINFFKRRKQSGLDIFNFSIKSNYVGKPIKREGE